MPLTTLTYAAMYKDEENVEEDHPLLVPPGSTRMETFVLMQQERIDNLESKIVPTQISRPPVECEPAPPRGYVQAA